VRATSALIRDGRAFPIARSNSSGHQQPQGTRRIAREAADALETVITDLPVGLVACDVSGRHYHQHGAALELHCLDSSGGPATLLMDE